MKKDGSETNMLSGILKFRMLEEDANSTAQVS